MSKGTQSAAYVKHKNQNMAPEAYINKPVGLQLSSMDPLFCENCSNISLQLLRKRYIAHLRWVRLLDKKIYEQITLNTKQRDTVNLAMVQEALAIQRKQLQANADEQRRFNKAVSGMVGRQIPDGVDLPFVRIDQKAIELLRSLLE